MAMRKILDLGVFRHLGIWAGYRTVAPTRIESRISHRKSQVLS